MKLPPTRSIEGRIPQSHLYPHSVNMYSRYTILVVQITALAASTLADGNTRPVITEHPADVRVNRGAPATLNCGAYGVPAPTVSWFKDGERVFTGGGDHTVLLPGGALFFLRTVENHRSRDSGTYTCRAQNQEGVVYSNSATLTVTCKLIKLDINLYFDKLLSTHPRGVLKLTPLEIPISTSPP
mgnify:CR=1 FL=1